MNHYVVFGGRKWENVMGKAGISWDLIGVFQAEDANQACLVAAQKHGVGTCVAIEGYAWGVDTVDAGAVSELGVQLDPIQRLERMAAKLTDRIATALPAPSAPALQEGESDASGR